MRKSKFKEINVYNNYFEDIRPGEIIGNTRLLNITREVDSDN